MEGGDYQNIFDSVKEKPFETRLISFAFGLILQCSLQFLNEKYLLYLGEKNCNCIDISILNKIKDLYPRIILVYIILGLFLNFGSMYLDNIINLLIYIPFFILFHYLNINIILEFRKIVNQIESKNCECADTWLKVFINYIYWIFIITYIVCFAIMGLLLTGNLFGGSFGFTYFIKFISTIKK